MQNKIETTEQTEPRQLHKPVRARQELDREQLVTYTDESGGGDDSSNSSSSRD